MGAHIRLLFLLLMGREGVWTGRIVVEKKGLVVSWRRDRGAWVNIDVEAGKGCGWGGWGGGGVGNACHFGPMGEGGGGWFENLVGRIGGEEDNKINSHPNVATSVSKPSPPTSTKTLPSPPSTIITD